MIGLVVAVAILVFLVAAGQGQIVALMFFPALVYVLWKRRSAHHQADRTQARPLQVGIGEQFIILHRPHIPADVKRAVWARDGGRCVECHSNRDLEYDHIIPFGLGGASTVNNLQLLCMSCNRHKGATIGV